jgi:protoporphyrinogen oxidase
MMLTITIDDELVSRAKKVGRHKNDMEAIIAALQEYITKHERVPSSDLSLQDWVSELYGEKKPENVVETLLAERREEPYDV